MSSFRVQCLSNLAQLQHGTTTAAVAVNRSTRASKRDSTLVKQESTEKLLEEKDEEIRKMQAMIQQMQSQLNHQSIASADDSSTTV